MRKAGIEYQDAPLYIPPYEYYNKEISAWAKNMGIQVVNYTPGTMSNADYTTPDMKNYRSSKFIYDNIMIRYLAPSTSSSVPAYFPYNTVSPAFKTISSSFVP